jgi:hypothetical protein
VSRLEPADAAQYQALRMDGIVRSPRQFRVAAKDEAGLTLEAVAARLAGAHVVDGFEALMACAVPSPPPTHPGG